MGEKSRTAGKAKKESTQITKDDFIERGCGNLLVLWVHNQVSGATVDKSGL